jgi:hypothetical protein
MKFLLRSKIKLLAPWWHDIYFPELEASTFDICGIDSRVVYSQYQVKGFPSKIYEKLGLAKLEKKTVLEIGPASGYYGLNLSKKNRVIAVEKQKRFVRQLKFLKSHFKRDSWLVKEGVFPEVTLPNGVDAVLCLGVLYYYPGDSYLTFIKAIQDLSPELIYLETLISKKPIPEERLIFKEEELKKGLIDKFKGYYLKNRIDLVDSDNSNYNSLSRYRSLLVFAKSGN